tara:strand:+ start:819 stop:947 length:129 start_codon:yes stop_codon:yes gene_type:complete
MICSSMIPSYLSTSMKIGQLNPTRKTPENIEFILSHVPFPKL